MASHQKPTFCTVSPPITGLPMVSPDLGFSCGGGFFKTFIPEHDARETAANIKPNRTPIDLTPLEIQLYSGRYLFPSGGRESFYAGRVWELASLAILPGIGARDRPRESLIKYRQNYKCIGVTHLDIL